MQSCEQMGNCGHLIDSENSYCAALLTCSSTWECSVFEDNRMEKGASSTLLFPMDWEAAKNWYFFKKIVIKCAEM